MTISQATVARLYDRSVELAEQLENDPDNAELQRRYRRAAARFRRAQRDLFAAACSPEGSDL